jgi:hypothetical protein
VSSNAHSVRLGLAALASAASALAAATAGAQPAAQPRTQQCLYVHNINGFNAPNDHTIYVRSSVSDIWRLDLMTDCIGLSFKQGFRLRSAGGDPWICEPIQADVSIRDVGMPQRCPVSGLHKLTPDEVAALPRRDRP